MDTINIELKSLEDIGLQAKGMRLENVSSAHISGRFRDETYTRNIVRMSFLDLINLDVNYLNETVERIINIFSRLDNWNPIFDHSALYIPGNNVLEHEIEHGNSWPVEYVDGLYIDVVPITFNNRPQGEINFLNFMIFHIDRVEVNLPMHALFKISSGPYSLGTQDIMNTMECYLGGQSSNNNLEGFDYQQGLHRVFFEKRWHDMDENGEFMIIKDSNTLISRGSMESAIPILKFFFLELENLNLLPEYIK